MNVKLVSSLHRSTLTMSVPFALLFAISCGPLKESEGLHLAIAADTTTDVDRIRFTVERIACGSETITPLVRTIDRDLENGTLPSQVPDAGVDPSSQHRFADWFVTVLPGCYRASIQPLATDGQASMQCAPMTRAPVLVERGRTTEVTLVSQCQNQGRGAIDVVAVLNHAPELLDVQFTDSKFASQCVEQEVCATVGDSDRDPLEIVWSKLSGGTLINGPTVSRRTNNADGSLTECVTLVAQDAGRYELAVSVYDLLRTTSGNLIRFDQYFSQAGAPYTSHDQLNFPFDVNGDAQACVYTVGGTVSGLGAGESLILQNNGRDNLTISTNGAFTFATPVTSGSPYAVTILTSPSASTCTLTNGSGVSARDVNQVAVTCAPAATRSFTSIDAFQQAAACSQFTRFYFDGTDGLPPGAGGSVANYPFYANHGVQFEPFTGGGGYPVIYRNQQYQIAEPGHDGILANNSATAPVSNLAGRAIRATLTVPVHAIGVRTNSGDGGYIEAFDPLGTLLGRADIASGGFGGITSGAVIARVVITNTFNGDIQFGLYNFQFGPCAR